MGGGGGEGGCGLTRRARQAVLGLRLGAPSPAVERAPPNTKTTGELDVVADAGAGLWRGSVAEAVASALGDGVSAEEHAVIARAMDGPGGPAAQAGSSRRETNAKVR